MKLITLMRAAGRALARQVCEACIERCDLIAGSGPSGHRHGGQVRPGGVG